MIVTTIRTKIKNKDNQLIQRIKNINKKATIKAKT